MHDDDYTRLRTYYDDLAGRIAAKAAWYKRHPDCDSDAYAQDIANHELHIGTGVPFWPFASSFDPDDPMPNTADLLSSDLFASLVAVALQAYEKAIADGR